MPLQRLCTFPYRFVFILIILFHFYIKEKQYLYITDITSTIITHFLYMSSIVCSDMFDNSLFSEFFCTFIYKIIEKFIHNTEKFYNFVLGNHCLYLCKLLKETATVTTETTTVTTETAKESPTNTTETILKMISKNPKITTREIAAACGITEDGAAYHIKKLKQNGKITRVGGARYGGEWKVN